jgi:hypothetical protein
VTEFDPAAGTPISTMHQGQGTRRKQAAISLVQLITNPEKFDGAEVLLVGYLAMDRPGREDIQGFLHLNKEDALRMLGANVELSFSQCGKGKDADPLVRSSDAMKHDQRYVAIHGRFVATPDHPMRPGMVCSITVLNDLPNAVQDRGDVAGAGGGTR